MPSTFLGLNTAYSGLCYFQAGNNTTSHNISNSNTAGYTRQQVIANATQAIRVNRTYGMMGTGVTVTAIQQVRNIYYDNKYRLNIAKEQTYAIENDYLLQVQSYLDEISGESGYTAMLSEVTAAIEDLTINPSGETERTQYVNILESFTDLVNEVAVNLQQSQSDANDEILLTVNRINSISQQLYELGKEITITEAAGGTANDLRDKRNLLIDELAELVNVDVVEKPVTYGMGEDRRTSNATTLEVRINGELLVDNMDFRQLTVVPRSQKVNQNDIDGLYDVYWSDRHGGALFDLNNGNLTGKLKGLFNIRDGNNADNLGGTITGVTADTVTVELTEPIRLQDLTISAEGSILLNYKEYFFDGWEAQYETNDRHETVITSITFNNLKYRVTEDDVREDSSLVLGTLQSKDMTQVTPSLMTMSALQGRRVDYKGIPYYMRQLNEFVRTFSKYMNDIHTSGADLNGDPGLDLFTALDTMGDDFIFKDVLGASGTLSDSTSSYWRLTALNWDVNTQIKRDNDKVVVATEKDIPQNNTEAHSILDGILYGFTDTKMFKQGSPSQFLDSIMSSISIDTLRTAMFADNLEVVVNSIDFQRKSVSNVDTNEEAANLIIFQNGYNLNSKVISVLNEMYDKLINQTGL